MEVIQHNNTSATEEIEIKMPLINQYKEEEEEEAMEDNLVGRQARRANNEANGTTTTNSTMDEKDGGFSNHKSEIEECVVQDGSENGHNSIKNVYFDNNEGAWKCRHCIWIYHSGNSEILPFHRKQVMWDSEGASTEWSGVGQDLKDEDFRTKLDEDIQRVISAVINGKTGADLRGEILSGLSLPPSTKQQQEAGGTNANGQIQSVAENFQVDIVDEIDEEVIELEFERAVEKMHTHDYEMYCPNCSNRISKVVLRRRKIKRIPASSDAQLPKKKLDLFGCLSCFSIFIDAGNKLNPFRLFGRGKEPESSPLQQQQQASNGLLSTSATGSDVPRQHASDVTSSITSSTQIKEQGIVTSLGSLGNSNQASVGSDTVSHGNTLLGSTAAKVAAAVAIAGNRFQASSLQSSVLNGRVNIDSEENLGENHVKPGSEISQELNSTDKQHQVITYHIDNSNETYDGYNANGTIPNGKALLGSTASKVAAAVAIAGNRFQNSSFQGSKLNGDLFIDINKNLEDVISGVKHPTLGSEIKEEDNTASIQQQGRDVQVVIREESSWTETSQFTESTTVIKVPGIVAESPSSRSLEILKAIVYGGLMESIASLSIVSSAAASGTSTLKVLALGLAYVISGLVVLGHNLRDLKYDELSDSNEVESRYRELLGTRKHFGVHAVVAVVSYLVSGLIPPLTYAFTFRGSDDTDYKLLAVSAVSLFCITILAISKAHTRGLRNFSEYFKAVVYYVTCAVMVGGIAYAVGDLGEKLMERLGWWDSSPVQGILIPGTKSMNPGFASS